MWDVQGLYLQQVFYRRAVFLLFLGSTREIYEDNGLIVLSIGQTRESKELVPPPPMFSLSSDFFYIPGFSVGTSCQEIPFLSFLWAWESPNQPWGTNSTNPACFHSAKIQENVLARCGSPESMAMPNSPGLARRPL